MQVLGIKPFSTRTSCLHTTSTWPTKTPPAPLFIAFGDSSQLQSRMDILIYIRTIYVWLFSFFHPCPHLFNFCPSDNSNYNWSYRIFYCGFELHLDITIDVERIPYGGGPLVWEIATYSENLSIFENTLHRFIHSFIYFLLFNCLSSSCSPDVNPLSNV